MRVFQPKIWGIWLLLLALATACHRPPTDTRPYFPPKGADWAHRDPAQVGINADKLAEAVAFAKTQETTQMAPDFSTQPGGRSRRNLRQATRPHADEPRKNERHRPAAWLHSS